MGSVQGEYPARSHGNNPDSIRSIQYSQQQANLVVLIHRYLSGIYQKCHAQKVEV